MEKRLFVFFFWDTVEKKPIILSWNEVNWVSLQVALLSLGGFAGRFIDKERPRELAFSSSELVLLLDVLPRPIYQMRQKRMKKKKKNNKCKIFNQT